MAQSRDTELLRQQNVLAQFGERALKLADLDEILQQACSLVREALSTDLAKVMELQDDGVTLLVRAGVGWQPGIVGKVTVKAEEGSSERRQHLCIRRQRRRAERQGPTSGRDGCH